MYEIVLDAEGPAGVLYALRAQGRLSPLYHDTLIREVSLASCSASDRASCIQYYRVCGRGACRRRELLQALTDRLEGAIDDFGFTPDLFRDLGTYPFPVAAMDAGPFRLLGLRFGEDLFVALDGGFKRAKTLQDDPHLSLVFAQAKRLNRALRREERAGRLRFERSPQNLRYLSFSAPFLLPG